jgi:hypothetical protein
MCAYNPAQPSSNYFTIGDAIAALGFTFAIQQLLKPIYLFRLRVYGLRILHLSVTVFVGALCSLIAAVIPNLPIKHDGILEYPVFWELLGGGAIFAAYGMAAWVTLTPARIYAFNLASFVRAAASLLSEASDDDRVNFAQDVFTGTNLKRLFAFASAHQRAEWHATMMEFERLRETAPPGASLTVSGRQKVSPFYLFAHRRELAAASDAIALLRVMSDPDFCAVLVRRCSWLTAAMLDRLAKEQMHIDQANPFVQEIAYQALMSDESMLAKEVSYTGFGSVPYLSESLFANWFILNNYNPIDRIGFRIPETPSEGFAARLNRASKLMLHTAIKDRSYWAQQYIYSVQGVYEHLFQQRTYARPNPLPAGYSVTLHMGIAELYRMMRDAFSRMESAERKSLFVRDKKSFKNDIVDAVASIIYESLACVANDFKGGVDDAWTHVIQTFMDLFPQLGTEPSGMDPLQQRLAIKLIDNLNNNMNGWYPAISRILLTTLGPYPGDPQPANRTAFMILKDAVYWELKKLGSLNSKNPEKVADFLPPGITFDPASDSLKHGGRGGTDIITNLSVLSLAEIDLCNEENWNRSEASGPPTINDPN